MASRMLETTSRNGMKYENEWEDANARIFPGRDSMW